MPATVHVAGETVSIFGCGRQTKHFQCSSVKKRESVFGGKVAALQCKQPKVSKGRAKRIVTASVNKDDSRLHEKKVTCASRSQEERNASSMHSCSEKMSGGENQIRRTALD